jgi:lipopolysaccharide/colanic/teichoic acid biosynthesis glycosyltransferase
MGLRRVIDRIGKVAASLTGSGSWWGGRLAPLAGGLVVLAASHSGTPLADAVVTCLLLAVVTARVRARRRQATLCPVIGRAYAAVDGCAAVASILALQLATGRPQLSAPAFAVLAVVVSGFGHPRGCLRLLGIPLAPTRVAYIGSEGGADRLARVVERAGGGRFDVIGRIRPPREQTASLSALGSSARLPEVVVKHRIDLLVLGAAANRLETCEQLARCCLDLPVRLTGYADFCEQALGHVPTSEIDATWFEHFLRPSFAPAPGVIKRSLDIVLGAALFVLTAPLILLLALLVRRDGGEPFFAQERIGHRGRPFRLVKLRTMRVGASSDWAQGEDDPRVTPLGRVLRRTHLDELPELMNVVRGEMSLVGPRPEQPVYVAHLERALPFYDRRNLLKPGLTGWAVLRCGYGGSDAGSAWKLCHDLYYIKHRTLSFDLLILAETAAEILTGRGLTPDEVRAMFEIQFAEDPLRNLPPLEAQPGGVVAMSDYEH